MVGSRGGRRKRAKVEAKKEEVEGGHRKHAPTRLLVRRAGRDSQSLPQGVSIVVCRGGDRVSGQPSVAGETKGKRPKVKSRGVSKQRQTPETLLRAAAVLFAVTSPGRASHGSSGASLFPLYHRVRVLSCRLSCRLRRRLCCLRLRLLLCRLSSSSLCDSWQSSLGRWVALWWCA